MALKIVTDFTPTAPKSKFDADAAELIEAFAADPDVIGAITVDVLGAEDDADAQSIVARETRSFQAAVLKAKHSARVKETRDNGDGSFDVLFGVTVHTPRKPRETVETVEANDYAETDSMHVEAVGAEPAKSAKK